MNEPTGVRRLGLLLLATVLAGCATAAPAGTPSPAATAGPATIATSTGPSTAASPRPSATTGATATDTPRPAWHFPVDAFAALATEPVSRELAFLLQETLDRSAGGDGVAATVISPDGTWSGAAGMATPDREMDPRDQMAIGSITKTIIAAQVMQLIEKGELALLDEAADRLPPDLEFDTNGATIEDLLSMRSGISEYFADEEELLEALIADPGRVWTIEELLATVDPKRGPVGPDREWEYLGTNYLLLGLIIEHVAGRPVAEVLRAGVLSGVPFTRLIYQPDERPTEPMAMPGGKPDPVFSRGGGYLPSIANATLFTAEGAMASDARTLARWFHALCAGRIVSPASVDEMTDLKKRPEYGLGIWDRRFQYGWYSGALGHTGLVREGYRAGAFCFQDPVMVVVVIANARDHDVETTAGNLWKEVGPG